MLALRSLYLCCALAAVSIVPGYSSVVLYTDQISWQLATTGVTTIDFEGIATTHGQTVSNTNTTGLVIGGVTFQAYTGLTTVQENIINPTPGGYWDYGTGSELYWSAYNGGPFVPYLTVTLPQAVKAVGLNIMTFGGSNVAYTVALNDLNFLYSSTPTTGYPTRNFFGLTSDTTFTTISFQLPPGAVGVTPVIDNFGYGGVNGGSPSDTPEACTFLLIASGLILMARYGRRWSQKAQPA